MGCMVASSRDGDDAEQQRRALEYLLPVRDRVLDGHTSLPVTSSSTLARGRVSLFEPINSHFPHSLDDFWAYDAARE